MERVRRLMSQADVRSFIEVFGPPSVGLFVCDDAVRQIRLIHLYAVRVHARFPRSFLHLIRAVVSVERANVRLADKETARPPSRRCAVDTERNRLVFFVFQFRVPSGPRNDYRIARYPPRQLTKMGRVKLDRVTSVGSGVNFV